MTYTIPGIPPSNNEYIGRTNYREYQRAKKMWAERIALCCRPKPRNPFAPCPCGTDVLFPRTSDAGILTITAGKMLLDGLKSAGIIEDDSFNHIELIFAVRTGQSRPAC